MRYWRAYRYVFDSPHWLANLAYLSLCILSTHFIPVIGQLLVIGYACDVAETLHRQGHDRTFPDFRWDRLVPYLTRGAFIFLIQLIIGLPVMALLVVAVVAAVGIAAFTEPQDPSVLLWTLVPISVVVAVIIVVLLALVMVPLVLRVGFSQELGAGFSWAFVKDFLGRMWGATLKLQLFLIVSAFAVTLLGLALCFVGMYPASALVSLATYHLYYQLYELYLERGGMPIPLKEDRPLRPQWQEG